MDENKDNNVVQPTNNNQEENVVTPIEDKRDLADKTVDKVESFMDTKDHSSEFNMEDVNKNKNNAVLCYIPLVSLFFIVNGSIKKSDYLKFHANEGLDLTLFCIIVFFGSRVLSSIFRQETLILSNIPGWLEVLIDIMYFLCFSYILFGVIYTYNGSSKELPIIGKIKLIK